MRSPVATRVPALDGLRGVAVLLVLVGHLGWVPVKNAGLTGVTLFFVLSGFLITRLLLEERERTGGIDLRAFYLRRSARLLPALLLCVVVVTAWAALDGQDVAGQAVASLLYVQNLVLAHTGESRGLLAHTWSLALEEQFYLLWPLVLLVRRNRRWIVTVGVLGAVASFVARVELYDERWSAIYFNPLTSCFPLLAGCALAAWRGRVPDTVAQTGLWVVVASAVVPVVAGWHVATIWWPAVTTLAAVAAVSGAAAGRLPLAGGALVWLGVRSYAVYLWHLPLAGLPPLSGLGDVRSHLAASLVALVVAAASWRWVEQPFLRAARRRLASDVATGRPAGTAGRTPGRRAVLVPLQPDASGTSRSPEPAVAAAR